MFVSAANKSKKRKQPWSSSGNTENAPETIRSSTTAI